MPSVTFKVRTNPNEEPPIIVPLKLEWTQAKGVHLVTLNGDRNSKPLYEGRSLTQAKAKYDEVNEHYKARKKAEGW